jgi:hypothetical protein
MNVHASRRISRSGRKKSKIQKVDLEMNENNIIKTIDGCTAHCTLTKNVMHTYAQCETFIMHMK